MQQPDYKVIQHRRMEEINGQRVMCYGSFIENAEGRTLPHGLFMALFPNGKIARSGSFNLGRKEGVWLDFDQEGSVTGYLAYTQFTDAFVPKYEQRDIHARLLSTPFTEYQPQTKPAPN